jgi:hypothetical protein
MKCRWNRTMLNLCGILVAILKMATGRNFSMSGINSGHHNLPTYEMDAAQIQHCSISTSWIDSRHRKNSTGLHFQNGHHNTAKIQHCSISKVAFDLFFKPVVGGQFGRLHGRNCLMSGINSGHHNLPTYEMALISDNVEFLRYCGGHFENGDW